eukprot:Polyplicarium_translucidae@DN2424_c0_g1_i1.p1
MPYNTLLGALPFFENYAVPKPRFQPQYLVGFNAMTLGTSAIGIAASAIKGHAGYGIGLVATAAVGLGSAAAQGALLGAVSTLRDQSTAAYISGQAMAGVLSFLTALAVDSLLPTRLGAATATYFAACLPWLVGAVVAYRRLVTLMWLERRALELPGKSHTPALCPAMTPAVHEMAAEFADTERLKATTLKESAAEVSALAISFVVTLLCFPALPAKWSAGSPRGVLFAFVGLFQCGDLGGRALAACCSAVGGRPLLLLSVARALALLPLFAAANGPRGRLWARLVLVAALALSNGCLATFACVSAPKALDSAGARYRIGSALGLAILAGMALGAAGTSFWRGVS